MYPAVTSQIERFLEAFVAVDTVAGLDGGVFPDVTYDLRFRIERFSTSSDVASPESIRLSRN